jgi:MFS family permease
LDSLKQTAPAKLWRSPGFRRVAIAATITYIGYYSMRAVIPLRLVNELGADEGFMAVYGVIRLVVAVVAAALAARLTRRIGNRTLLAFAMVLMAVVTLLLAGAAHLNLAVVSALFGGAAWTIVSIGLYGFLADNTPNEARVSAAFNQTTYLATIIGPMLGSLLASTALNLAVVLMIGAFARLAAGVVIEWLRSGSAEVNT